MFISTTKFGRKLNKAAMMTDIHWGRKGNSPEHNQDCLDYIDWFCDNVRKDPTIDHINFLGDWHENRSALNIATLKASLEGARKLNDLGLPVFFIVGNHDLYNRHNRDIHGLHHLEELTNFIIVDQPVVYEDVGEGTLYSPFLFHNEYENLVEALGVPVWCGHFEFRGFVITGHSVVMPTGPEANDYAKPKKIFSGHFHKRQANKNIVYIGNAFPMDFSDAGDTGRGMCVYDHSTDDGLFYDWEDCPKYQKCTLSSLIDKSAKLLTNARVRCIVDVEISFEESAKIKQAFVQKFNLREFTLEESKDLSNALKFGEGVEQDADDLKSVDDLIMEMLNTIEAPQIDKNLLIKIFQGIV